MLLTLSRFKLRLRERRFQSIHIIIVVIRDYALKNGYLVLSCYRLYRANFLIYFYRDTAFLEALGIRFYVCNYIG